MACVLFALVKCFWVVMAADADVGVFCFRTIFYLLDDSCTLFIFELLQKKGYC